MPHPALSNTVVLLKVFQCLSLKELKQIRKVCFDWDVPACSILGKRTHLNVNSVCDDFYGELPHEVRETLQPEIKVMKRGLLRRIRVQGIQLPDLNKASCLIFLKTYGHWIQEIAFRVDWDFGPTMKALFENVTFTNLKKISISEIGTVELLDHDAETLSLENIPILSKIQMLELDVASAERANSLQPGHRYLPIFQELINKSPIMNTLTITGNVYPDLSSVFVLNTLMLEVFPVRFIPMPAPDLPAFLALLAPALMIDSEALIRPDFSITGLEVMLGQAENRTEVAPFIKLPSFPKLGFLMINPLNGFVKRFEFSQNSCPSLEHLVLGVTSDETYQDTEDFVRSMGPQATVKKLNFKIIQDRYPFWDQRENPFHSIQPMVTNFPNVTKLDIVWKRSLMEMPDSPDSVDWMKELTKFQGLEDLTLRIRCRLTLSELMGGIAGAGFTGLKKLQLDAITSGMSNIIDDDCNNFAPVFASIPKVSFIGFSFKASTPKRMLDYFEPNERNERLQFID